MAQSSSNAPVPCGESDSPNTPMNEKQNTPGRRPRYRPNVHGHDPTRFYCPYPGCTRSFVDLWRLKVHYRAPPSARGSGRERGHGMELPYCPKCGQGLERSKHHTRCVAGRVTPSQSQRTQDRGVDENSEAAGAEGSRKRLCVRGTSPAPPADPPPSQEPTETHQGGGIALNSGGYSAEDKAKNDRKGILDIPKDDQECGEGGGGTPTSTAAVDSQGTYPILLLPSTTPEGNLMYVAYPLSSGEEKGNGLT